MLETEHGCMESESMRLPGGMPGQAGMITFVAEHRVSGFREMHANLVSLPGLQTHANESRPVQSPVDAKVRYGGLAFLLVAAAFPQRVPLQTLRRRETALECPFFTFERPRNDG